MQRREFLGQAAALSTALAVGASSSFAADDTQKRPQILLRSSWQIVNIGDIAHTPGVLALLEKHIPEADVKLWASKDLSDEVAAMEHKRFPKLKIVKGTIDSTGKPSSDELAEALATTDFLLHGSGPSLVAEKDVAAFHQHFAKPFGIYGITYGGSGEATRKLVSQAKFAYFRDTVSLARAKSDGITAPIMEFGPDGAFAVDLADDAKAAEFVKTSGLTPGKFVCCIPRNRWTPYWRIHNRELTAEQQERLKYNDKMAEQDHAVLREAIIKLVKSSEMNVLLCPEDKSQMLIGKEHVYDKLPDDVRQRVVWRESFWLTDEALSVYKMSAGLFGLEMHSPIMCIGNGIPAIVGRFAEQTSKGFMWRDIGLEDWLFDFDVAEDRARYADAVVAMATDRERSAERVKKAQQVVTERQRATMLQLRKELGLSS